MATRLGYGLDELSANINRYAEPAKPYFAAFGALSASLIGIGAAYQVAKGFTSYCLAAPLAMGINVRDYGEWAGWCTSLFAEGAVT